MRKTILPIVFGLGATLTCLQTRAEGSGTRFARLDASGVRATAVSPDGRLAVGVSTKAYTYGDTRISGFDSFLWNIEDGTYEYLTEFDESDLSKSGYFTDINNDGVIVGYFKDESNTVSIQGWEGWFDVALNVASVWKNGTITSLGLGGYSGSDFESSSDGSFASAVSADANTIVGYIYIRGGSVVKPCAWKWDSDAGAYVYQEYALPEGCTVGQINDISADGSIAVGSVKIGTGTYPCIWNSYDSPSVKEDWKTPEEDRLPAKGGCYAISPNGSFIAGSFDGKEPVMFRPDSDSYNKIGSKLRIHGVDFTAVSDNGDAMGCWIYGNPNFVRPSRRCFWWSINTLVTTDLDYWKNIFMSDADVPYDFTYEAKENTAIICMSADGKTAIGNDIDDDTAWVMHTDVNKFVTVPPAVESIKAKVLAPNEVTVSFDRRTPERYMYYTGKSYDIYRDGDKIASVDISELPDDQKEVIYVDREVPAGTHSYSVCMVYEDGDIEVPAPRSEITEVPVEDTFALPFFDNFDSASLATNYWQTEREYGELEYQSFGFGRWMGLEGSFDLHFPIDQNKPYSFSLVSRHFDATEENHVYISFAKRWQSMNGRDDWPLDKDFMTIEVSDDNGESWEVVSDMSASDIADNGLWSFDYIDISDRVAGKVFQLRIHPHGEGLSKTSWSMDWFKVGTDVGYLEQNEIKGLTAGYVDEDNVKLMWENSVGAYSLTYLSNPYFNTDIRAIGDEGKTFIAACSYLEKDLAPYDGKYLTAVTAFINEETSVEYSAPTHASVVVYEDNKLVCDQEFEVVPNSDNVVKLETPIRIDKTKELKIGVKIFDYDERQWPLTYQNAMMFVKNRSDLYSQDGGKTWLSLDDFYKTVEGQEDCGKAAWEIVGNITESPEAEILPEVDPYLFGYSVYKNGENISRLFSWWQSPFIMSEMPAIGDRFQVLGFLKDGRIISSEIFTFNGVNSVSAIDGERQGIMFDRTNDRIILGPDVISASVYDIHGRRQADSVSGMISTASLEHGIYVVTLRYEDGTVGSEKIIR